MPEVRSGVPVTSQRASHIGFVHLKKLYAQLEQSFAFARTKLLTMAFHFIESPILLERDRPTSLVKRPTENKLSEGWGICHTDVITPFFTPRDVFIYSTMSPIPTS